MDMMGLRNDPYNSINLHVGGVYGDKSSSAKRFCENFKKLQDSARQRLTVENDDKINLYSTLDLYTLIHSEINIPIIFDYHHHSLCSGGQTEEEALKLAVKTWPEGIKPVAHYSSSKKHYEDANSNPQSHADYLHEKIKEYGLSIDIEVEAKAKEAAVILYLQKFENK